MLSSSLTISNLASQLRSSHFITPSHSAASREAVSRCCDALNSSADAAAAARHSPASTSAVPDSLVTMAEDRTDAENPLALLTSAAFDAIQLIVRSPFPGDVSDALATGGGIESAVSGLKVAISGRAAGEASASLSTSRSGTPSLDRDPLSGRDALALEATCVQLLGFVAGFSTTGRASPRVRAALASQGLSPLLHVAQASLGEALSAAAAPDGLCTAEAADRASLALVRLQLAASAGCERDLTALPGLLSSLCSLVSPSVRGANPLYFSPPHLAGRVLTVLCQQNQDEALGEALVAGGGVDAMAAILVSSAAT